jgi:hypothetical protein
LLIVNTLYNPVFAVLPPSAHAMYGETVQGVNDIIRGYLAVNPGAFRLADVFAAFAERYGLVSYDMTHPSDRGHAVIAAVVIGAIDGTPPELSAANGAVGVLISLLAPALQQLDRMLIGTLGFVRNRLPSVWAFLTQA